jgi:hypothetical protein
LKVHGKMTTVGLPDDPFSVMGMAFASNGAAFGGSHIACKVYLSSFRDRSYFMTLTIDTLSTD